MKTNEIDNMIISIIDDLQDVQLDTPLLEMLKNTCILGTGVSAAIFNKPGDVIGKNYNLLSDNINKFTYINHNATFSIYHLTDMDDERDIESIAILADYDFYIDGNYTFQCILGDIVKSLIDKYDNRLLYKVISLSPEINSFTSNLKSFLYDEDFAFFNVDRNYKDEFDNSKINIKLNVSSNIKSHEIISVIILEHKKK